MFIAWIKRKLETRRRAKEQVRKEKLHFALAQLRELFLALDEFMVKTERIPRPVRRNFWRDFRAYKEVRSDIFEALLEDNRITELIGRLTCQKRK